MSRACTATPEVGKFYRGTVQRIVDFGAFVEILPSVDGSSTFPSSIRNG